MVSLFHSSSVSVCMYKKTACFTLVPHHSLSVGSQATSSWQQRESLSVQTHFTLSTHWSSDGSDNPQVPEVLWDDTLPYPTYTALQSSSRQTAARNESSKKRICRAQGTVFLRWIKNKWWFRGVLIEQVPSISHSHSLISLRCFGGSFLYKTYEQIATKKPVRQNTRKHENGKADGACFSVDLGWIVLLFLITVR